MTVISADMMFYTRVFDIEEIFSLAEDEKWTEDQVDKMIEVLKVVEMARIRRNLDKINESLRGIKKEIAVL